MWPEVDRPDARGPAPYEPVTLLSWLIGLPIAGAVAVLFLPRQTPALLRVFTMLVMFATLAASRSSSACRWGAASTSTSDVAWMPRWGIRYHVAADGISLWLLMLTAVISPSRPMRPSGRCPTRLKDWCFALLLLEGAMIGRSSRWISSSSTSSGS